MKILHICPQKPEEVGGGTGILQTLLSLKIIGHNVDYIGPEINNSYSSLYDNVYYLKATSSRLKCFFNLLKGIDNRRYDAWKKLSLNFEVYDLVIIEFTKLDYVLKRLNNRKIVVHVHNCEFDYSRRDYKANKTLKKFIVSKFAKRQEKKILRRADAIVALTEKDKKRLVQLYSDRIESNISIIPLCFSEKGMSANNSNDKLTVLFCGSLCHHANEYGICWFIQNVLSRISFSIKLIIAGKSPTYRVKQLVKENRDVVLIDTPESMDSYYRQADVVIAPIFEGDGMQGKVACALSYGKPVVGTSLAFEGYRHYDNGGLYVANTAEEYEKILLKLSQNSPVDWEMLNNNAYSFFKKHYSLEASSNLWNNILYDIRENK